MIVTLIGYRGTGKSTVGQQLAARLNWECVDSDQLVESRTGSTIAEIFASDGEPHFRHLERTVLDEVLHGEHRVVSAGGGAILDALTRQQMSEAGPVVWLQASAESIHERLSSDPSTTDSRPALTEASPLEEIALKLAEREPLYAEIAALIVNTDNRDVTSIVDEIVSQLPFEENMTW